SLGDRRGAAASFERLIGIDPVHEEAYARLMRLAASQGQRHVAVRWYGRLVESLRDELGVEPDKQLQRVYAGLGSGRLGPADLRVEANTEASTEGNTEAGDETNTGANGEAGAEANNEARAEAHAEARAEARAEAGAEAGAEERKLVTVLAADLRGLRGD